jgi:hypothetical protein
MTASYVAILCSFMMTSASVAASITVSDTSVPLAGVAAATTSLLLDGKFHLHNSGSGKFYIEVKKVHCDRRSNGPHDASNPHAGPPMLKCRFNAKNKKDTTSGRRFGEARAITDICRRCRIRPQAPSHSAIVPPAAIAAPLPSRSAASSTRPSTISTTAAAGPAPTSTASRARSASPAQRRAGAFGLNRSRSIAIPIAR